MFCKNCGRQLDEGDTLCPACGTLNGGETSANTFATIEYGIPALDETLTDEKAGQALKWGILSLAFSSSGCLSLLGFIFSFVAKSKALDYERTFGRLEGRAKVGRILGKVGFGVGLGMTIYMGFAVLLGVVIGLSEASASLM